MMLLAENHYHSKPMKI